MARDVDRDRAGWPRREANRVAAAVSLVKRQTRRQDETRRVVVGDRNGQIAPDRAVVSAGRRMVQGDGVVDRVAVRPGRDAYRLRAVPVRRAEREARPVQSEVRARVAGHVHRDAVGWPRRELDGVAAAVLLVKRQTRRQDEARRVVVGDRDRDSAADAAVAPAGRGVAEGDGVIGAVGVRARGDVDRLHRVPGRRAEGQARLVERQVRARVTGHVHRDARGRSRRELDRVAAAAPLEDGQARRRQDEARRVAVGDRDVDASSDAAVAPAGRRVAQGDRVVGAVGVRARGDVDRLRRVPGRRAERQARLVKRQVRASMAGDIDRDRAGRPRREPRRVGAALSLQDGEARGQDDARRVAVGDGDGDTSRDRAVVSSGSDVAQGDGVVARVAVGPRGNADRLRNGPVRRAERQARLVKSEIGARVARNVDRDLRRGFRGKRHRVRGARALDHRQARRLEHEARGRRQRRRPVAVHHDLPALEHRDQAAVHLVGNRQGPAATLGFGTSARSAGRLAKMPRRRQPDRPGLPRRLLGRRNATVVVGRVRLPIRLLRAGPVPVPALVVGPGQHRLRMRRRRGDFPIGRRQNEPQVPDVARLDFRVHLDPLDELDVLRHDDGARSRIRRPAAGVAQIVDADRRVGRRLLSNEIVRKLRPRRSEPHRGRGVDDAEAIAMAELVAARSAELLRSRAPVHPGRSRVRVRLVADGQRVAVVRLVTAPLVGDVGIDLPRRRGENQLDVTPGKPGVHGSHEAHDPGHLRRRGRSAAEQPVRAVAVRRGNAPAPPVGLLGSVGADPLLLVAVPLQIAKPPLPLRGGADPETRGMLREEGLLVLVRRRADVDHAHVRSHLLVIPVVLFVVVVADRSDVKRSERRAAMYVTGRKRRVQSAEHEGGLVPELPRVRRSEAEVPDRGRRTVPAEHIKLVSYRGQLDVVQAGQGHPRSHAPHPEIVVAGGRDGSHRRSVAVPDVVGKRPVDRPEPLVVVVRSDDVLGQVLVAVVQAVIDDRRLDARAHRLIPDAPDVDQIEIELARPQRILRP